MSRSLRLIAVLLFSLTASSAQTASEIESEFGKPTNAYSVSANIWMTPDFAADGQVCRMRLYQKRISGNTNYVGKLTFADFKDVVDRLVPPEIRGVRGEPFDENGSTMGGGVIWATFTYEIVRITYSAGFRISAADFKDSKPFNFEEMFNSLPPEDPKEAAKPKSEFETHKSSPVEIVTITWLQRKCVE